MYLPKNLSFSSESFDVLRTDNTTYSTFMESVLEYAEAYGQFNSLMMMEKASTMFKEDASQGSNGNNATGGSTANADAGTGAAALWNKLKAAGQTLGQILKKIVAKLKDWLKILWLKLKELFDKIREKLNSIGVEESLNNMKANPNKFKYNKDYFDNKVAEADFASPRSDELNTVYMKAINAYEQAINDIAHNQFKGDIKNYVDDKLNEEIKKAQDTKVKGKDFTTDAKTAYFSENLNQALGLVFGLYQSLNSNKYETVCKPFADKVSNITKTIDTNSNALLREYYKAIQAKDSEGAKKIQENSKNYVAVSNAVVGLAGHFRIQMVQMNLSRLRIINTFIALWKTNQNDNQDNSSSQKEEPKKENSTTEDVNGAKAP